MFRPQRRFPWLVCLVLVLPIASRLSLHAAVTTTGKVRQPRTLWELARGIEHTLKGILTGDELEMFSTMSPEEIRSARPDLYERISGDVRGWTEEWLAHVRATVEPVPAARLRTAQEQADRVDGLLRTHFAERRWPYRTMQVVFLPPRLFLDQHDHSKVTGGMYMRFYPDVFFANVDGTMPLEAVLVHEGLHFNKRGAPFGSPLTEGITEMATRDLVARFGLRTSGQMPLKPVYIQERKGVDYLLDEMMRRTSLSREAALEQLLQAYLSGDQSAMETIFGAEIWKRVLTLGDSHRTWQRHRIERALTPPEPVPSVPIDNR